MPDPQTSVQAVLDDLVASGQEIGLQVAVYRHGELIVDAWAGVADRATGAVVGPETLFTVFSVSKGVTATALHILAERGLVSYDEPIAAYWPEFAVNGKERILVRHALSHLAGIPHMPPDATRETLRDWNATCDRVAAGTPLWEPGERLCYHAISYGWIVGGLIERASGRPFAEFAADEIATPLGLDGLYFGVPASELVRIAALEANDELLNAAPGPIPNIAPPGSIAPDEMNRTETCQAVLPAYGMCANARSLAKTYASLVGEGVDGVRLLSPERTRMASALQIEAIEANGNAPLRFALGFRPGGGPDQSVTSRITSFGHDGYGGANAFADPEHGLAIGLTKNRLVASAPGQGPSRRIIDAMYTALGLPN